VAAFVTLLAVSVSGRAPDKQHQYGHGKIENLSALFETLLLLVTCVWIIYEAIQRLFVRSVEIEPSIWAFVVMGTSLIALIWISGLLYRTAHKYHSQALEADALHFKTDIWSTIVVILGLLLVLIGELTSQQQILGKADAIAALGVAVIVVKVSLELGKRTIDALIDTAPPGIDASIAQRVRDVPGVEHVDAVRVRRSGPETFADVTISVPSSLSVEEAHVVASAVEEAVRSVVPQSDVMVHTDPHDDSESVLQDVRQIARRMRMDVHNIDVQRVGGHLHVALDLEVQPELSLRAAHNLATQLEKRLRADIPEISRIDTHIEPRPQAEMRGRDVTAQSPDLVGAVKKALDGLPLVSGYHNITILHSDDHYNVSVHCTFDPDASIGDVHRISDLAGERVRTVIPSVQRVIVHSEP
jgi:cation diffusion facilitator family transporter